MNRYSLIAALACTLMIGACGTEGDNPFRASLGSALKQLVSKKNQQVLNADILRARLTPEVRASLGRPTLIAEIPALSIAAVVLEVERNGDVITWQALDGVGLSTKSGLLISTRGIGYDVMSSDVAAPLAAIKGQAGGTATRLHRFLDGEDQEILHSFVCRYSGDRYYVIETCKSTGLTLENQYWLDRGGEIWRSKQWAGVRNGYILLERPAR